MSDYSSTPPSSLRGPRSPLFGTATFTSVHQSQASLPSSRHSSSSQSYEAGSSYDSDDASSDRRMRRINLSPTFDSDAYSYSEEESMYDRAQVEAELTELDDEIQETLDMWGSAQAGYPSTSDHVLDRGRRVLSTITEHTEDVSSRPNSFATGSGRPTTQYSTYLGEPSRRSTYTPVAGPSSHVRASTDPVTRSTTPGRPAVSNLIAQFEAKKISMDPPGHSRTASAPSAPAGPRSPSPYATTSYGPIMPSLTATNVGLGYTTSGLGSASGVTSSFYGSRPSSPTKSRAGSMVSGPRAPSSVSGDSRRTPSTHSRSQSEASGYSSTPSRTFTGLTGSVSVSPTDASTSTPTANPSTISFRRPQGSPRSPLAQVKNVVSAFKAKTPVLRKAQPTSPSRSEGRVRRSRRSITPSTSSNPGRERERARREVSPSVTDASRSESTPVPADPIPPPFDVSQLGEAGEPLNIGLLWYLNVHELPPYRWRRCQAVLYPHMLVLTWIVPGGRRGTIMLDLLNCISVGTALSPQHPQAADDIGAIAAKEQSRQPGSGEEGLLEMLSPFHLMYDDGTERLGTDSPKERLAWINAIRDALDRPITIPDRSSTRSPTASIRTIGSMRSNSSRASGAGSASTTYISPLHTGELAELVSLSGSSSLSRRPSVATAHLRAVDDSAVDNQTYLPHADPRVIPPSRASSIRRTSSLTDLSEEIDSAVRRARARHSLGFGIGLATNLTGGESPVTISSGPRLGSPVSFATPPRARSRPRGTATPTSLSDDNFFSATGTTRTPTTSWYSASSSGKAEDAAEVQTDTLFTNETIEFASSPGLTSTSYLGLPSTLATETQTGQTSPSATPSVSPSRGLARSRGVRRRTGTSGSRSAVSSTTQNTEETSDKENRTSYSGSESYTQSTGSYPTDFSTLPTLTRTTDSYTTSTGSEWTRSGTPTPSVASSRQPSDVDAAPQRQPSSTHSSDFVSVTAKSPSASLASLPTIPSESDFVTAEVGSSIPSEHASDFITAGVCPTETETDFITADVCECETPAPTEYITAEVCPSVISTDYETAQCHCPKPAEPVPIVTPSPTPTPIPSSVPTPEPVEREVSIEDLEPTPVIEPDVLSSKSPSGVPSIPEETEESELSYVEIEPKDIPLPPSTYTPSVPTTSLLSDVDLTPPSLSMRVPSPSTMETPSVDDISSVSFPGPSPPESLQLPPLPSTLSTVSSPTESSVTPTSLSDSGSSETVASTVEQPSISSPSIPESLWAAETDRSYDSSVLRPSLTAPSIAIHEGLDTSFETSFMRPTTTPQSSPPISLRSPSSMMSLTPSISITVSSVSPPSPSPASPLSETPTRPTPSLPPSVPSPTPVSSELSSDYSSSYSEPSPIPPPSPSLPPLPPASPSLPPLPPPSPSLPPLPPSSPSLPPLPTTPRSERNVPRTPTPREPTPTPTPRQVTPAPREVSRTPTPRAVHVSPTRTELRSLYTESPPSSPPSSPSPSTPSESPLIVPFPPPQTPPTPSVSMRLSVTTPRGMTPSIHSALETIPSEPEPPILPRNANVDDIDKLMKMLQDAENARGSDSAENRAQIQELRDLLNNLIDELRQREAPPPPAHMKDVSVGRSSVPIEPEVLPPPPITVVAPQPQYPLPMPELPKIQTPTPSEPKTIYISPPRRRGASPETLADSASFLSSHHSDDWSLMESESYPGLQRSLSWSSSEPSSPESSPSESDISEHPSSAVSIERDATPSPLQMPIPHPASPDGSAVSSVTARPFGLPDIRQLLDALRDEIDHVRDGQDAANRMLDEVRQRAPPMVPDYDNRLARIEELLQDLLSRPPPAPVPVPFPTPAPAPAPAPAAPSADRAAPPPSEVPPPREESEYESSDGASLFRVFRDFLDSSRADLPPLHMPAPHRAGPTLDERLAELAASEPPAVPPPVQPPPPLVPLIYRPGPRLTRPRSTSPTFDVELPACPSTVPIAEPVIFERPPRAPRVTRTPRQRQADAPAPAPGPVPGPSQPRMGPMPPDQELRDTRVPQDDRFGARTPATMLGAESTGPDIDMLREVQRRRQERRGGDGTPGYGRAPSAPPELGQEPPRPPGERWYQAPQPVPPVPPPGTLPTGVPPPGIFPTQPGMPPPGDTQPATAPAFVLPPGGIEGIVELLRDQRAAQTASIDQQREIMRYLRALNDWLGRDVQDRQSEIRAVAARVDDLRALLEQLLNSQAQGQPPVPGMPTAPSGQPSQMPHPIVFPPGSVQPGVQPGIQPPVVPMPMPQPEPVIPGVIPGAQQEFPLGFVPDRQPAMAPFPPSMPTPSPQFPVIPERPASSQRHPGVPVVPDYSDDEQPTRRHRRPQTGYVQDEPPVVPTRPTPSPTETGSSDLSYLSDGRPRPRPPRDQQRPGYEHDYERPESYIEEETPPTHIPPPGGRYPMPDPTLVRLPTSGRGSSYDSGSEPEIEIHPASPVPPVMLPPPGGYPSGVPPGGYPTGVPPGGMPAGEYPGGVPPSGVPLGGQPPIPIGPSGVAQQPESTGAIIIQQPGTSPAIGPDGRPIVVQPYPPGSVPSQAPGFPQAPEVVREPFPPGQAPPVNVIVQRSSGRSSSPRSHSSYVHIPSGERLPRSDRSRSPSRSSHRSRRSPHRSSPRSQTAHEVPRSERRTPPVIVQPGVPPQHYYQQPFPTQPTTGLPVPPPGGTAPQVIIERSPSRGRSSSHSRTRSRRRSRRTRSSSSSRTSPTTRVIVQRTHSSPRRSEHDRRGSHSPSYYRPRPHSHSPPTVIQVGTDRARSPIIIGSSQQHPSTHSPTVLIPAPDHTRSRSRSRSRPRTPPIVFDPSSHHHPSSSRARTSPRVVHVQSSHRRPSGSRSRTRTPPQIVYAPSSRRGRSRSSGTPEDPHHYHRRPTSRESRDRHSGRRTSPPVLDTGSRSSGRQPVTVIHSERRSGSGSPRGVVISGPSHRRRDSPTRILVSDRPRSSPDREGRRLHRPHHIARTPSSRPSGHTYGEEPGRRSSPRHHVHRSPTRYSEEDRGTPRRPRHGHHTPSGRYRTPTPERRGSGRGSPYDDRRRLARSPVHVHSSRRPGAPVYVEGEQHAGSRSPTLIGHPSEPEPLVVRIGTHTERRSPSHQGEIPHVIPGSAEQSSESLVGEHHHIPRSPPGRPIPIRSPSRVTVHRPPRAPTIVPIEDPESTHHGSPTAPHLIRVDSRPRTRRPSEVTHQEYPTHQPTPHRVPTEGTRPPSEDLERAFSDQGQPSAAHPHTPRRPVSSTTALRDELRRSRPEDGPVPYIPSVQPTEETPEFTGRLHESRHRTDVPSTFTASPSHTQTPLPVPVQETPHIPMPEPTTFPPSHEQPPSPSHPPVMVIPSEYSGPRDLDAADRERERADRFSDLAHRMEEQLHFAEEEEENRDRIFRTNEDERERIFLDHEARRDQEAMNRREEIFRDVGDRVEERLASLPSAPAPQDRPTSMPVSEPAQSVYEHEPSHDDIPMVPPPVPHEQSPLPPHSPLPPSHLEDVEVDARTIAQSIQSQVADATSRYLQEMLDTIRAERADLDEARTEAARIREELDAERERRIADVEAQNNALKEELANLRAQNDQLKNDLEQERQLRITEDEARRETEREEARDRADSLARQLSDVTNIVSETRDECARKREVSDERWTQKEAWHESCNTQMDEMKQMLNNFQRMFEDDLRERQAEREAEAGKPSIESIVDQLRDENAQLRELLRELSEGWRAETRRQHDDLIDAVKATAQEQVPYNISGYLDEFSKTLAKEVRQLLNEVNDLALKKSSLQHEIVTLLEFRRRYDEGGIFWRNMPLPTSMPVPAPEAPQEAPPPPPQEPDVPQAAPSAWRPVRQRRQRRGRDSSQAPAPAAAPPPMPAGPTYLDPRADPRYGTTSWATWQPRASMQPSPVSSQERPTPVVAAPPIPQEPPGLFGPRTPRSSYHGH